MGEPKGLVDFDGRPWLEHQLDALEGLARVRAIVVLGADREKYLRALPDLGARATIAVNPAPERGPFSSLLEGLSALDRVRSPPPTTPAVTARRESVFVLPVDVPVASAPVWIALTEALRGQPAAAAAVPCVGGRGGHPVLLAPRFVAELRAMSPLREARLDQELRQREVARVVVDDARVGLNLNTRQDWEKVPRGS
jgi:CTP:molybdopterin cytidylyltransferase MocA